MLHIYHFIYNSITVLLCGIMKVLLECFSGRTKEVHKDFSERSQCPCPGRLGNPQIQILDCCCNSSVLILHRRCYSFQQCNPYELLFKNILVNTELSVRVNEIICI
jgi:hypothetical protein